ncbi:hypothetical protein B0H13DRAFT_2366386 [Mycena leptocephala]|nr:hypothetical protein B0H13DRAFT_2366386 [Mycena leptocephala]
MKPSAIITGRPSQLAFIRRVIVQDVVQEQASMPSLFSRARTASTPSKSKHKPPPPTLSTNPLPAFSSALLTGSPTVRTPVDEFGVHNLARSRSAGGAGASAPGEAGYGAVGFLPTTLPADPHTPWASSPSAPPLGLPLLRLHPTPTRTPISYLEARSSPARPTASSPPHETLFWAWRTRPGCALALDVRRAGVIRLVNSFLATCRDSSSSNGHGGGGNASGGAEEKWLEEARFAGPHELGYVSGGACPAWRRDVPRIVHDRRHDDRQCAIAREVDWDDVGAHAHAQEAECGVRRCVIYAEMTAKTTPTCMAASYPPTAFSTLLASLPAQLPPILAPLFALCTKLIAHSNKSGETPPSLASVLSPLLFGLTAPAPMFGGGPVSPGGRGSANGFNTGGGKKDKEKDKELEAEEVLFPTVEDFSGFVGCYEEYLRGARASEHLLLACIREGTVGAEKQNLGAPTRLREWVGMYPGGLEGVGWERGIPLRARACFLLPTPSLQASGHRRAGRRFPFWDLLGGAWRAGAICLGALPGELSEEREARAGVRGGDAPISFFGDGTGVGERLGWGVENQRRGRTFSSVGVPLGSGRLHPPLTISPFLFSFLSSSPISSPIPPGKSTGARRGAKTVRIVHVRRNVRSYSQDLVRGGSSWAGSGGSGAQNDWAASKAWRAILAGGAGAPRYAESYRKRMDLGVGVHPSTSSLSSSYSSTSSTSTAPTTYGLSPPHTSGSTYNLSASSTSSLASEDAGAFRSLTDLKWGEFESLGFGGGGGSGSGSGGGGGLGGHGGAKEGGLKGG